MVKQFFLGEDSDDPSNVFQSDNDQTGDDDNEGFENDNIIQYQVDRQEFKVTRSSGSCRL